jgi:polyhydroxyalkanoate synthesis repressor PhaR
VPRRIRRYANRKLYDADGRRYVTLEELGDGVAAGEDLQVLDQRTGEDVTNLTLAQMLLDAVREGTARIPRPVLVRLVRLSRGPASAWGRWMSPQEAAVRARAEVERLVGGLLAKGRLSLEEGLALRQDLARSVHGIVAEAQSGGAEKLRRLFDARAEGSPLAALRGRLGAFGARLDKSRPRPRRSARPPRSKRKASKGRTGG